MLTSRQHHGVTWIPSFDAIIKQNYCRLMRLDFPKFIATAAGFIEDDTQKPPEGCLKLPCCWKDWAAKPLQSIMLDFCCIHVKFPTLTSVGAGHVVEMLSMSHQKPCVTMLEINWIFQHWCFSSMIFLFYTCPYFMIFHDQVPCPGGHLFTGSLFFLWSTRTASCLCFPLW